MFAKKDAPANADIREGFLKAGLPLDLETDPIRCHEKLLNGYFHLVILPKEYFNLIPLTEGEKTYPRVKKWCMFRAREYDDTEVRDDWLKQHGFSDWFISWRQSGVPQKVNTFFEEQYREFGWNLIIENGNEAFAGKPFRWWSLLEDIAIEAGNPWGEARVDELEDLVRFLYHDDHKIWLFYPALWVEDGLSAIETWSIQNANARVKRSLLLIGKSESVNRHIKNHENCGADSIPGTIHQFKKHFINGFGAVRYTLDPFPGTERLCCVADLLSGGFKPGDLAKKLVAFYENASERLFQPQGESVKEFEALRMWLNLPDVETIIQRVSDNLNEIIRFGGAQIILERPNVWKIQTNGYQFTLDTLIMKDVIDKIYTSDAIVRAETSLGKVTIRNLLVEKDSPSTVWASDYRTPDFPACRLYNLTQIEAELRYELGQKLSIVERIELEKILTGQQPQDHNEDGDSSPYINDKLGSSPENAGTNLETDIRHLYNGVKDFKYGEQTHQAAMLLHALSRLVQIQSPVVSREKIIQVTALLSSVSMLVHWLAQPTQFLTNNSGYILDLKGEKDSSINGNLLNLTTTEHGILIKMQEREDHIVDRGIFQLEICRDNNTEVDQSENFQVHIKNLRKKIDKALKSPGVGMKIIITERKRGYRLTATSPVDGQSKQ